MTARTIVFHCDSPGYGGSEIDLQRVVGMLEKGGQKICLVCADADKKLFVYANSVGLDFHSMPTKSNRLHHLPFGIWRGIKVQILTGTRCVHMIWAHHLDSNRWLQVALAISGVPFVLCERLVPSSSAELNASRLTSPLLRILASCALGTLVCGYAQMKNLPAVVGGRVAGLFTIPNSRPVEKIHETVRAMRLSKYSLREKLGIPVSAHVMLCVARLCDDKNQELVIRALPDLLMVNPSLIFVMVGDGEGRDSLLKVISELKIEKHVILAGQQADTLPYYASADLFLLPSQREGLSGALLEAIACGLPCLVSDIEANQELIKTGHTGFLFKNANQQDFIRAVAFCCANPERCSFFAKRAYVEVFSRYDESVESGAWLKLVNSLQKFLDPVIV